MRSAAHHPRSGPALRRAGAAGPLRGRPGRGRDPGRPRGGNRAGGGGKGSGEPRGCGGAGLPAQRSSLRTATAARPSPEGRAPSLLDSHRTKARCDVSPASAPLPSAFCSRPCPAVALTVNTSNARRGEIESAARYKRHLQRALVGRSAAVSPCTWGRRRLGAAVSQVLETPLIHHLSTCTSPRQEAGLGATRGLLNAAGWEGCSLCCSSTGGGAKAGARLRSAYIGILATCRGIVFFPRKSCSIPYRLHVQQITFHVFRIIEFTH